MLSRRISFIALVLLSAAFFATLAWFQVNRFDADSLRYNSDLPMHLALAAAYARGEGYYIAMGFHFMVLLVASIAHLSLSNTGIVIVALSGASLVAAINWTIRREDPEMSVAGQMALTVALLLPSAIVIPAVSPYWYLGYGSPNVWHSPTLYIVKTLAFLAIPLLHSGLASLRSNKAFGMLLIVGIVLALGAFVKPNLALVFVPAVGLYVLAFHRQQLKTYLVAIATVVPALVVLLLQYLATYGDGHNRLLIEPAKLGFDFFTIWRQYSSNVVASFVLAAAFPISVIVAVGKSAFRNRGLMFSWLLCLVGVFEYGLMIEEGSRLQNANWIWGYLIGLSVLFVYSAAVFTRWFRSSFRIPRFRTYVTSSVAITVFFLHSTFGTIYLVSTLVGINPVIGLTLLR